jgi:hypothetical protein
VGSTLLQFAGYWGLCLWGEGIATWSWRLIFYRWGYEQLPSMPSWLVLRRLSFHFTNGKASCIWLVSDLPKDSSVKDSGVWMLVTGKRFLYRNPLSFPSPTHPWHVFSPMQPPWFHNCDLTWVGYVVLLEMKTMYPRKTRVVHAFDLLADCRECLMSRFFQQTRLPLRFVWVPEYTWLKRSVRVCGYWRRKVTIRVPDN